MQEVKVMNLEGLPDPLGEALLFDIRHTLGIDGIELVRTAKVYRLEGIGREEAVFMAERLLAEKIFQRYTVNAPVMKAAWSVAEVAYKPGVMNPESASIMKSAADLGLKNIRAADSSRQYAFDGPGATPENIDLILKKLLVNETVERVVVVPPVTLLIEGAPGTTEIIPIREMSDDDLINLSRDKLFLNLEEMKVIQGYFMETDRDPTDCEIETLAQTWSEHCVHKTFKARLKTEGRVKDPLLKRLQKATAAAGHKLVLSAFEDNSGVMEFYEGWAICGKVETHNSPSAIEPYGGAMTGSGGVFRDIMGTGLGARVVASTDMFCFSPPDMKPEDIPDGCLNPKYLLRKVVAGVRDYGNRMGIPTNNGSIHFHDDFRAKPSVIVGAYGILPVQGALKGRPDPGDLAVVIGGRTGRDGIHGATFSSGEMTQRTVDVNASAVQIGNPIEEKRTADALLAASSEGLIKAVTDCGAGGFASAIGEMGSETGVVVWLERAPLKYTGLSPWEIWLSESQERMAMAVKPENWERVAEICRQYNVEATVLGLFDDTRRLVVTYEGETVCDLDMDFLHNGLPLREMDAQWVQTAKGEVMAGTPEDWAQTYCSVMGHLDVCSKEPVVRMYDHGVQGTNAVAPFGGVKGDGPSDAVVLAPVYGRKYGMVISHGLNPVLNSINPYHGSMWAIVEAMANAVAVGADPGQVCLIDNFIWPFPDPESLGALDMAVDACTDFVKASGIPFISGKDSLSSTYRNSGGEVIKIPPVLCISVFGRIEDVGRTCSADFKETGSSIILVGKRVASQMAGSAYSRICNLEGENLPQIDPVEAMKVFKAVHAAISEGRLLACHDISEGGLAAALAEMCFGGDMGVSISVGPDENAAEFMFNETAGCFLAELPEGSDPDEVFSGVPFAVIGYTTGARDIVVGKNQRQLFRVSLESLKNAWKAPMKEVFGQ